MKTKKNPLRGLPAKDLQRFVDWMTSRLDEKLLIELFGDTLGSHYGTKILWWGGNKPEMSIGQFISYLNTENLDILMNRFEIEDNEFLRKEAELEKKRASSGKVLPMFHTITTYPSAPKKNPYKENSMSSLKRIELENGSILEIFHDQDCRDPREDDNLGSMICFHRRYTLGDKHEFDSPDEFLAYYTENKKDFAVILPLYLLDHSGLSMSVRDFGDKWDSGQVGWIYVKHDKLKKEELDSKSLDEIKKYLMGEVKYYDSFLRGECYGYKLWKPAICPTCKHQEEEDIDSCWGFIGDFDENGLLENVMGSMSKKDIAKLKKEFGIK